MLKDCKKIINIYEKSKIKFALRRGIFELEIMFNNFFENHFDSLKKEEKKQFLKLIKYDDLDLLDWLVLCKKPKDLNLLNIIYIVRKKMKLF